MSQTSNPVSKTAALFVAALSSFITPFISASTNIALPAIGREFSMDAILLGWVATVFILTAAVFLLPFGRLADIYGRKKIFTWGTIIYTISSLLISFAPSAMILISLRVVQGIGISMIFSTGVAILISVYPPKERGKALGISASTVYLGLSLGPPLGGLLVQQFGWRSIFWATVPLGLAIILIIRWKLKGEWAEAKGEKFDLAGSIIYGLSLTVFMYGLSELPALRALWLIAAGVLGLIIFLWWETRVSHPVFRVALFKNNTAFTFSNLSALLNYSATFAAGFLLSLYLQQARGLEPRTAGLILVSQPVMMAILSPVAGRLSDRVEPSVLASIGMALSTAGLVLLAFLGADTALPVIAADLVVLGTGFGFFSSPNTNAVMSSIGKELYGVASATLGTMRLIGQMLSLGIVMFLFSLFVGRVQITPEYYPLFLKSMKVAFIVFAILCFVGIFASLRRGKVR
ncbi:MAG: MFS transporter [Chloroflexota bacterium]